MEAPDWILYAGAAVGAGLLIVLKGLGVGRQVEKEATHECSKSDDIKGVLARLEAGSITFAELRAKTERAQQDIAEVQYTLREVERALAHLIGRIDG